MAAFTCKNCAYDLTSQIDFTIQALQDAFYDTDGDVPEDISTGGECPVCSESYEYSGPMFTHYLTVRIEENMLGEDQGLITEVLEIDEEQSKIIDALIKEDRRIELDEYIRELLKDTEDDE